MSDRPIDLTAQMDQMGATMRSFAPVVAQFYRALVAEGIPDELAGDLTMQWQGLYFSSCYGVQYRVDG